LKIDIDPKDRPYYFAHH